MSQRALVGSSLTLATLLVARLAGAADHSVYARAHSAAGTTTSFSFPDLTDVAEAKYSLGAAGVDDAFVNNVARADSRTGSVSISSAAGKMAGPGMPAGQWGQVARIEQRIGSARSGGATTALIRLTASGSAMIATTSLHVRLTGRVQIASCTVVTSQIIKSTGADPVEAVDNCRGSPNLSGSASPGSAAILVKNLTTTGVVVSAEVSATYEGSAFVGTIQASINGGLSIEQSDGALEYGSPTFLAARAPADGAPGSGGNPTASVDGGSGVPSATPGAPTPAPATDDDGCRVSRVRDGARVAPVALALALAGALALRLRRRSHPSDR